MNTISEGKITSIIEEVTSTGKKIHQWAEVSVLVR
ncbi:hypothetical protein F900_02479 [Acinetobacter modestus]|jgi:hypothetical protein|uniref:Uncharacterized protein n=1 Tax=Acinetobacter modestus TaxID=1776740 RepID=N9LTY0_9GAMM|nr:hypothetical protein F900_02479 [Acinetobacter modestus]